MPVTVVIRPDIEAEPRPARHCTNTSVINVLEGSRKGPLHLLELLASSFGSEVGQQPQFAAVSPGTQRPVYSERHGLVHSVVRAYNHHHHLSIRPDDVWLAILSQLSLYINAHAEDMRSHFVSRRGGQEKLRVTRAENRFVVGYEGIVDDFNEQIKLKLKDAEVHEWLMPGFSTTTPVDAVAAGVSVMAVVSKYFGYGMSCLCGIPSVTLEGTKEDWIKLRMKAQQLTAFGKMELERWSALLAPILSQFIHAFEGQHDIEGFWGHMVKYSGMSSGPYIDGWISYFAAFDEDGQWQLHGGLKGSAPEWSRTDFWFGFLGPGATEWWSPHMELDRVPNGSVEVRLDIDDNGVELEGRLLVGLLGWQWDEDTKMIRPHVGWAAYTINSGAVKQEEDGINKRAEEMKEFDIDSEDGGY